MDAPRRGSLPSAGRLLFWAAPFGVRRRGDVSIGAPADRGVGVGRGRAEEESMGTSGAQGEPGADRAAARWTSRFDEGDAGMRDRLGGKGAGLAEVSRLGLPRPPGFPLIN